MTSNSNYFSKLSDGINNYNVKDSNAVHSDNTNLKIWTGTKAQYDAISSKDSNTLYNITDDTDTTLTLLEALYPVGSVYITTASTCPLSTLISGSSWSLVSSGRVLQGADNNHSAGSTIEAGLPNITGNISANRGWGRDGLSATGAFQASGSAAMSDTINGYNNANNVTFDASRSSSIYGNSSTVQPPAYVVNIWKRTA